MKNYKIMFDTLYLWTIILVICKGCDYNDGLSVHLENSGIHRIRKSFIASPNITCINLQGNEISMIEDGAFAELTNLRYLNLSENKLLYTGNILKAEFPTVKTLVLDEALTSIDEVKVQQYRNCYDCGNIRYSWQMLYDPHIQPIISIKAPQLKKLYLRRNNINRISITSWINMPNLTHLYLSDNAIFSVNFLENIPPTLTHIFLDNNSISKFESSKLHNIEELKMNNNFIHVLGTTDYFIYGGNMILKNAFKLKKLSLSNMTLGEIRPDALQDLISMLEIDLSLNNISIIPKNSFDNLINLLTLKLNFNKLENIPEICALKNLEILNLNNNKISFLNASTCSFHKLKKLFISHNKLTSIDEKVFESYPSLEELDLSWNRIQILPNNWIASQFKIRKLYLNSNVFKDIASMSLKNVTELEVLNIAGNLLEIYSIEIFENLPKNTIIDVKQMNSPSVALKLSCEPVSNFESVNILNDSIDKIPFN